MDYLWRCGFLISCIFKLGIGIAFIYIHVIPRLLNLWAIPLEFFKLLQVYNSIGQVSLEVLLNLVDLQGCPLIDFLLKPLHFGCKRITHPFRCNFVILVRVILSDRGVFQLIGQLRCHSFPPTLQRDLGLLVQWRMCPLKIEVFLAAFVIFREDDLGVLVLHQFVRLGIKAIAKWGLLRGDGG